MAHPVEATSTSSHILACSWRHHQAVVIEPVEPSSFALKYCPCLNTPLSSSSGEIEIAASQCSDLYHRPLTTIEMTRLRQTLLKKIDRSLYLARTKLNAARIVAIVGYAAPVSSYLKSFIPINGTPADPAYPTPSKPFVVSLFFLVGAYAHYSYKPAFERVTNLETIQSVFSDTQDTSVKLLDAYESTWAVFLDRLNKAIEIVVNDKSLRQESYGHTRTP